MFGLKKINTTKKEQGAKKEKQRKKGREKIPHSKSEKETQKRDRKKPIHISIFLLFKKNLKIFGKKPRPSGYKNLEKGEFLG